MRKEQILVCVCCGLVLSAVAARVSAGSSENPYQGIVERNVFNLKPIINEPPPPPPPPPPPKLILNAITSILGKKRALLQGPVVAKPGKPPTPEFYTLGEGQRDDDIEVIAIDEKAGTVKLNNHGTVQTLDFEKDGAKPVAISTPMPGLLQGRIQQSPNPAVSVIPRIPTRTMRLPPAAPPNALPGQGVPRLAPGVVSPQLQNNLTPEQRAALLELQRQLQSQQQPGGQE